MDHANECGNSRRLDGGRQARTMTQAAGQESFIDKALLARGLGHSACLASTVEAAGVPALVGMIHCFPRNTPSNTSAMAASKIRAGITYGVSLCWLAR